MNHNFLCETRRHVPGKGNKRCTNFAVHEVYVSTPNGKQFMKLCAVHYDQFLRLGTEILKHTFFPATESCPECGADLDFSKGMPLCTGNHPISGKTQRYFTERYPEYFQPKTLEVQGEIKCQ
jgi:hypothetical protein